ncbi:MAG: TIGR02444 family protein [Alphaproteobacteria bacterium]
MSEFSDHPFWDFSLDVYMSDGVGQACLDLQDAHELDVNIVLFCLWVAASGRGALTAAQMTAVTAAVSEWHHDVVRALRAVRVRMKGGVGDAPADLAESLRQRIQKTEIDCEHTEQLMLAASVDLTADDGKAADDRVADAVSNIAAYFATLGTVTDADRTNLGFILKVAFRDVPGERVDAAVAVL